MKSSQKLGNRVRKKSRTELGKMYAIKVGKIEANVYVINLEMN